ncbi:M23 family metallopeptidase [Neobittarella massiliensis]|uniref:M23 family metallopeptidase n=2 Tax=Oscillospiraceae TaxID=216572 RepID=A0A8J6LUK8_9FIRM|nr:M23 family metallopeptidase [Neobittarella massiliensis]MBC3516814.1 M23 family metallopeptidase [Neobittarella massiliensis]SCJ80220.1 Stage II sporulation protein Q [uncultured Anaerotruncus sp.]
MQKLHYGKSKFQRFFSGKGFYIALAACILGAGIASWALINGTMNDIKKQNKAIGSETPSWESSDTQIVEKPVEDQAKPSEDSSAQQNTQSSSEPASTTSPDSSASPDAQDNSQTAPTGGFLSPISGETINPFSGGDLVKDATLGDWRTHNGVDIAADVGTQVISCAAGTVKSIRDDDLWGTVIEIEFEGGATGIYKAMSPETTVKEGQAVSAGDPIGTIAKSCVNESKLAPHLHFELKQDGKYVDPTGYWG